MFNTRTTHSLYRVWVRRHMYVCMYYYFTFFTVGFRFLPHASVSFNLEIQKNKAHPMITHVQIRNYLAKQLEPTDLFLFCSQFVVGFAVAVADRVIQFMYDERRDF